MQAKKDNEKLNKIFGIDNNTIVITAADDNDDEIIDDIIEYNDYNIISTKKQENTIFPVSQNELNSDIKLVRKTMTNLISTTEDLLSTAIMKAEDDDSSPRDIEVAGNLVDKIIHASKQLLEIQKLVEPEQNNNTYIQNNIQNNFTTKDMIKQLKDNQ